MPQSNNLPVGDPGKEERIDKCLGEILAFAKDNVRCDNLGSMMALP